MIEQMPHMESREAEAEPTLENAAQKIRELKEAGIEPEGDDPRAQEVWDFLDEVAETAGVFEGDDIAREKFATIWVDNGWGDDSYFLSKAEEDLINDIANAEADGKTELVARLRATLERISPDSTQ